MCAHFIKTCAKIAIIFHFANLMLQNKVVQMERFCNVFENQKTIFLILFYNPITYIVFKLFLSFLEKIKILREANTFFCKMVT